MAYAACVITENNLDMFPCAYKHKKAFLLESKPKVNSWGSQVTFV